MLFDRYETFDCPNLLITTRPMKEFTAFSITADFNGKKYVVLEFEHKFCNINFLSFSD